ncbi:MAG: ABC transporter permease [Acidobacteriaceae bacterium]|nr:ABC transporter permease [Acidobacteriaceae bacterium]
MPRWWRRTQRDFAAEVQSHIELEAERLREQGLSEREARAQAQKAFGNVLGAEERFYESRRVPWMDHFAKDLVFALRQLKRNKTFAVVAVFTLALGIGSTTAIFTLVHATLLRALPYRDGDRIIRIADMRTQGQSTGGLVGVPRFFDLRRRSKSFESLGFFYFDHPTMIADGSLPAALLAVGVNGDFWQTIGIRPLLGRTFTDADDNRGAPPVAVISYAAWQRLFGGDAGVLNRQVKLDGQGTTIVGVLPPGIGYPNKTDIWIPAFFDPAEWVAYRGDGTRFINVLGRLKAGVTLRSAQEELRMTGERLQKEHPQTDGRWRFESETLRNYLYGSTRPALLVLMAAAGILLLIACINVANLLLSRGTTRAQEVALRRALGATHKRIVAQFLTENGVLALLGGAIGLAATYAALHWLGAKLPGRLGTSGVGMQSPIVWFTLSVSLLTGLVFGCVPALQARRLDLNTNLKQGDTRVGAAAGAGLRTAFISVEVALSLVLLGGASLLAESLWHLMKAPLGFRPEQVLSFDIQLPWNTKPVVVRRFFQELEQRVGSLPGVLAVGEISALPTVDFHLRSNFDVDWKPRTVHGDAVNLEDRAISGDYLRAMGIPLLLGRNLNVADENAKQPRALVNEQLARQYFPGGNILGHHLINSITQFEIVGVIGNVRGTAGSIAAPAGPELYFLPDGNDGRRWVVVRSTVPAETLAPEIRRAVHDVDPTQAIRDVATLTQRLDDSVAQPRFNAGLLTAFAVIAVLLACVGIYGVVSYSVTQRSIEIGIRMALGATAKQILSLFIRRALGAALIGLAAGGTGAIFLTRLLESQLYAMRPDHALTFLAAALLLLVPVLVASVIPASKAAGLNPINTLRRE